MNSAGHVIGANGIPGRRSPASIYTDPGVAEVGSSIRLLLLTILSYHQDMHSPVIWIVLEGDGAAFLNGNRGDVKRVPAYLNSRAIRLGRRICTGGEQRENSRKR